MQDQNLTNPITTASPMGGNAGISDPVMGIPNFAQPSGSSSASGAPAVTPAPMGSTPANPTPSVPVASAAPSVPNAPVAPSGGNDVSTMGIPPLQPSTTNSAPAGQGIKEDQAGAKSDAKTSDKPNDKPKVKAPSKVAQADMVKKIVEKLRSSENILIALSNNPSVDDIAAAVGLTLYLDSIQRHVTAIYSGRITEGLEFLQPEATFETNTDSLQDFIVALNKDKADHLRYKLEGDYVKVFITPYRAKITEEDLTFSYGDYNVDFVLALDVASPDELDAALEEHGRIMHSASTVNITTNEPGKFGEIDWSNPMASSVCEMVTQLILEMQGDEKPLDKDIATALLTGIVASTDRFSNSRTNSDTLGLASKLMGMGADQQLISANISGNEIPQEESETEPNDNLMVDHMAEDAPDNTPTIVMPTVNTDISAVNPGMDMNLGIEQSVNQNVNQVMGQNANQTMGQNANQAAPVINPAASLAGDASIDLGPDPAAMSIPSMVLQDEPMAQGGAMMPNSEMTPNNGVMLPDGNIMPPPINGELADRPDSVLPPPPMPPVDGSMMTPPA